MEQAETIDDDLVIKSSVVISKCQDKLTILSNEFYDLEVFLLEIIRILNYIDDSKLSEFFSCITYSNFEANFPEVSLEIKDLFEEYKSNPLIKKLSTISFIKLCYETFLEVFENSRLMEKEIVIEMIQDIFIIRSEYLSNLKKDLEYMMNFIDLSERLNMTKDVIKRQRIIDVINSQEPDYIPYNSQQHIICRVENMRDENARLINKVKNELTFLSFVELKNQYYYLKKFQYTLNKEFLEYIDDILYDFIIQYPEECEEYSFDYLEKDDDILIF